MKLLKRLDSHTQKRIAWGLLILAMVVYIAVMGIESVLRYLTFKATAFDLGNMDQVLWNTIHGRLFQFTNQAIDWYGPPIRLAVHVEPIMLPVSLLYALHADPRTLLIFQTLVLAAGAPAVFLLTRRYFPSWPMLAAVMAGAYLISPALLGINIFDFHPDSLATPLLLYAILALTYRRFLWFLALCFLVCCCKEDMSLAVAFLGILLIWKYRMPRLGLTLLLGGALWAYFAFKVVIPHFYTGVQANNFWYRYEVYGSTPAAALLNLLLHPWLIFSEIITLDRLYYLFSLIRGSGFLCLLAPEWLLPALPKFASNFLSTNAANYSGVYHYNAAIIPFVMLSAIHGTRRLVLIWQGWSKEQMQRDELEALTEGSAPDTERAAYPLEWLPARIRSFCARTWDTLLKRLNSVRPFLARVATPPARRLQARWRQFGERMYPFTKKVSAYRLQGILCLWLIFTMGLNYSLAIPQLNSFWPDHLPGVREQQIQQLLNLIPPDATVSASDDLNPHLSERRFITVFPAICVDSLCKRTVQYIVVDLVNPTIGNIADALKTLDALSKGEYKPVIIRDHVELLMLRNMKG